MSTPHDQTTTNYEEVATTYYNDTAKRLQQLPGAAPMATKHNFKGNLVVIVYLLGVVQVVMTVEFPSGEKLEFRGTGGGPIAGGGGASYGGGTSAMSPAELLAAGSMPFALQATPIGVALEFAGPGIFAGGGPNIAAGHAWGSGRWTKV